MIRHTRIDHFGAPLGLVTLAVVFKLLDSLNRNGLLRPGSASTELERVSDALAIASASLWVLFGILYLLKTALHLKKVVKEWRHPTMGNMFSAVTSASEAAGDIELLSVTVVAYHSLPQSASTSMAS